MKSRAILIAIVACFAVGASAQMSPMPKEMKAISWMAGKWEGDLTMSFGGQDSKSHSTMSNEMVLSGRYIRSMISYSMQGMGEMTGSMMITYNSEKKKWASWYFDSQSSDTMESNGVLKGDTIVFTSKPMAGQQAVFRTTFKKASSALINFKLEMKQGANWSTMMKGDYKKK